MVLNLDLEKGILHGVKRCPKLISGKSRRIGMEKLTVDRNGKSHFYSGFYLYVGNGDGGAGKSSCFWRWGI